MMSLETIIKRKREKAKKFIKDNYSEKYSEYFNEKGDISYIHPITRIEERDNPDWQVPVDFLMFEFCEELELEYYWRAMEKLKKLQKMNKLDIFSGDELKEITEIMIDQIYRGEKPACGLNIPDVWELIAEEESPLKEYVSEQTVTDAFNNAFWIYFDRFSDENKNAAESAAKAFARVIGNDEFFDRFNFAKGVEKVREAKDVTLDLAVEDTDFRRYSKVTNIVSYLGEEEWENYMKFFLIQESLIMNKARSKEENEKAMYDCAKLAAPLVYYLLNVREYEGRMKKLVSVFIQGDIINEKPIQEVIGEVIEWDLRRALDEYECSSEHFENLSKLLLDFDERVARMWEKYKDEVDLDKVPPEIKKHLPKKKLEARVEEVKQGLKEMKRFDLKLFNEWEIQKEYVNKAAHSKVRNEGLKIYFNQKVRPSKNDLRSMSYWKFSGFIENKFHGYLVMDLLAKKEWHSANDILSKYELFWFDRTAMQPSMKKIMAFEQGLAEYLKKHGRVDIDKNGLDTKTYFPKYNKIVDFKEKYKKLFT